MYYAQFFTKGVMTESLIEAVGDRSVIILDGRLSPETNQDIALEECNKRKFLAYQIRRGRSFTDASPVTGIVQTCNGELQ